MLLILRQTGRMTEPDNKNMPTNAHDHHQNTQTLAQILPERLIKHVVLTLHSFGMYTYWTFMSISNLANQIHKWMLKGSNTALHFEFQWYF